MRIGRKSRKIALSALSVTLAATMAFTLCANALPAGKTNASGKSIENVTGKYDTTDLRNSLINSDLLAESARDQDEQFWIFVNLKGDSVSERYDPSSDESLSEYATSEEASSISRTLISRQAAFLNELDRQGVEYTYKYSYTVLENSVGIRVRYGDISRICKMSGVESVAVSEHYAAPQAVTTNDANAWNTGIYKTEGIEYEGEGMLVAVLDTGFDVSHEAFREMPAEETLAVDKEDVENLVFGDRTSGFLTYDNTTTVDDVYYNDKVPFAYDYADKDPDVFPSYSSHGMHVAGIIAGNSVETMYDNDGKPLLDADGNELNFRGVAPQAQLAICKVFTDDDKSDVLGGAEQVDILAALEDCIKLGVDVINMSLGSSAGFAQEEDEYTAGVYARIREAGISLVVAASNDYSSGYGGPTGTNLTSNPDAGTVGAPSTYDESFSVASIDGQPAPYMIANQGTENEAYVYFNNAADGYGNETDFLDDMFTKFASKVSDGQLEMEYVVIPGYGRSSNYIGLNVSGKIAVVSRGGDVSFEDKMATAKQKGAAACIIYNNISGTVQMSLGSEKNPIPTCSVTLEIGQQLSAGATNRTGKILFDRSFKAGPFISSFSSWGPTPSLGLKPEITAHGGDITSCVPGGWAEYSGTSMATPNMAGALSLILQHIAETYPSLSANDRLTLAYQTVMSTATIAKNEFGNPYSPRKQGAGLADIKKAMDTKAYLSVDGTDKAKLELGDDPDRTGEYVLTFRLNNLSSAARSYRLSLDVFTETVAADGRTVAERAYMLDGMYDYSVTADGKAAGESIALPAGGSVEISVKLTLDADAKAYLDDNFANGMYVEGFVRLEDLGGDDAIDLNLPYLAFYGDWYDAPMMDYSSFEMAEIMQDDSIPDDEKPQASIYETTPFGMYDNEQYIIPMGEYVYELPEGYDTVYPDMDKASVSMYDSENNHTIYEFYAVYAGMLRSAKYMELSIRDAVTGELVFYENRPNVRKAYASGGSIHPSYVELEFNPAELNLSNNRQYVFSMKGTLDSIGREDEKERTGNTYSFTFTVDTEAPELHDYNIRFEPYQENKETKYKVYLDLEISDNHYAQSALLCYLDAEKNELAMLTGYTVPVNGAKNSTSKLSVEITDYYENLDEIYVQVDDYALNAAVYKLTLGGFNGDYGFKDTSDAIDYPDEISFAESELTIATNEVVKLTPVVSPADATATGYFWTSSNPAVAEVKDGEVIGRSAGRSLITVYCATWADRSKPYAEIMINVTEDEAKLPAIKQIKFGKIIAEDDSMQDATNTTVAVHPNQNFNLNATIEPWYYDREVQIVYKSSNETVATVDEEGNVRTLREGNATITATYQGENMIYSAYVTLAVGSDFYVQNGMLMSYHGIGGTVVIPLDLNISYIAEEAFKDNDNIEVLEISAPCAELFKDSFVGMTKLRRVILPETLTYVYRDAFRDCTALETVDLRCTSVTFGENSFNGCTSLKNIRSIEVTDSSVDMDRTNVLSLSDDQISFVSPRLTTIKGYAFKGCTALESVDLTWLRTSGAGAFEGCTALTEVTLSSRSKLAESMFKGCTSLTTLIYTDTDTLNFASASVFEGCNITSIQLQGSNYTIEDGAYYAGADKTELVWVMQDKTSFTVPASVKRIGENAFGGNKNLKQVTFETGSALEEIGSYAFAGSGIQSIVLPAGVHTLGKGVFKNCAALESADLTCEISAIPDDTFSGSALTSVSFDKAKVTSLGNRAFYATALTAVDFSDTAIAAMGDQVFGDCFDLVSVVMPKVTSLGYGTFSSSLFVEGEDAYGVPYTYAYSSLESVTFPDGATTLGTATFSYEAPNYSLVSVNVADSVSEHITVATAYLFNNCEALETLSLRHLQKVEEYAFYNCYALGNNDEAGEQLVLSNVTEAGDYAFYGCAWLRSRDLGKLTAIGDYAFALTTHFTEADLPEATQIGDYAFWLSGIRSLNIPKAESIGVHAFGYTDLSGEFVIPASVTYVGEGSFTGIPGLTALALEREYEDYFVRDGVLYRVLDGGYELLVYPSAKEGTSYTVLDGTVRIGENAFDQNRKADDKTPVGANALQEVVLPSSVRVIGDKAFYQGTAKTFTFCGLVAPVLEAKYVDPDDYDPDTYENYVFGVLGNGAKYYANFYNFLAINLYAVPAGGVEPFGLTLRYPANASGFDTIVYSGYFDTVEKTAAVASDETLAAIALLENIPTVEQFNALKTSKDTALLAEYKSQVTAARRAYNNVTDATQKGFITAELSERLVATETAMREVRALLGDPASVSRITVEQNPAKTVYTEGEAFDPAGLVLKVVYDDFSEETVTSGYTYGTDALTINNSYVEIVYNGAKTSVNIQVRAAETTDPTTPTDTPDNTGLIIGIGVAAGVVVLGAAAAVTVILIRRKKRNEK